MFKRKAGWLWTGLYIKATSSSLMRYYGGEFINKHEALPHPISLTRCGLPRVIPPFHRQMIRRRDGKADETVRFDFSLFSVSKLILVRKRQSFGFPSIVGASLGRPDRVLGLLKERCVSLAERYVPQLFSIPMNVGLSLNERILQKRCPSRLGGMH